MRNFYPNNGFNVFLKGRLALLLLFILLASFANGQAGAPEINVRRASTDRLSGSTYTFQDQNVNTSSSNLSFTIYNTGTGILTISDITLSGVNADQFKLNKTQTAFSINPGGSTTFTLAFAPTSNSPEQKNAALTINNNDSDESAYIINLTGKAVILAPTISATGGITPIAAEAGTDITITGTNLINTDNVFFTGANATEVPATTFTITSNTKITARVPANAVTGPITVRNVSGSAVSAEVFIFLNTYT
ncbi:MAG: choice-of-anchor D domain-containing protein, partial [Bacteroidota bacterium]|nr:choice-of-anchor D domain-containing protein [Bacteroidota bacterium]